LLKKKRELGFFDALIMGLSGAIGFEVFVVLGYPYFELNLQINIVFGLLVAGVLNLLIMLTYCELSTAMPEVGGVYTYIKAAYGSFVPFISGCFRWLASIFGAALAARVFYLQLVYLLVIALNLQGLTSKLSAFAPFVTIVVVVIMASLAVKGSRGVGIVIVFAFLAISAILIGITLVRLPDLSPIEDSAKSLPSDISGVLATAAYTFTMFFGVRSLIAGAARVKNPSKNLPKAILLSALVIIPLYIGIAYTLVIPVSHQELLAAQDNATLALNVTGSLHEGDIPFLNLAAQENFEKWGGEDLGAMAGMIGGALISVAGMIASLSALGTSLSVQASILRGMGRDAYLPRILHSVHERFGTPHIAIIAGSLCVMFLSTFDVPLLNFAAGIASLIVFAVVNLSLMKLRQVKPNMERPFKTPLYPFTPIASIIMSMVLIVAAVFSAREEVGNALMAFVGLTGLVLMAYYLKMVGSHRLKIGLGGAGVGAGVSLGLLTYLVEMGFNHILLVMSVIIVVVGIYAILRG